MQRCQLRHIKKYMYDNKSCKQAVTNLYTVYPKKYAHGFVVLCFVVVMQSFIMNLHKVFIHIHQGCFAGTGAIVRLPQCQWSKPDGYGKISQCITTTKHSKAKTVCIFLGIYCIFVIRITVLYLTIYPTGNQCSGFNTYVIWSHLLKFNKNCVLKRLHALKYFYEKLLTFMVYYIYRLQL